MFENLMQVEHPNIVKFHKYWLDMKETQARVRIFITLFFPHASSITLPHCAAAADTCPTSSSSSASPGHIHHRVHVIREPQAVPEENQEEPQDHERQGQCWSSTCAERCNDNTVHFHIYQRDYGLCNPGGSAQTHSQSLFCSPGLHLLQLNSGICRTWTVSTFSFILCLQFLFLGLEEMVHTDSLCPQVFFCFVFCVSHHGRCTL